MDIGASEIGVIVFTLLIILFSMVCTIVPIVLVVKFLSKMSGARQQLMSTGIPGQAKVVQMGMTGTSINDAPLLNLVLEVTPQVQPGYRGAATPFVTTTQVLVPMMAIPRIQPGAMVPVRYAAHNPQEIAIDFRSMGFM